MAGGAGHPSSLPESGLDASSLAPELFEGYEVLSSGDRQPTNVFEDCAGWERYPMREVDPVRVEGARI